MKTKQVMDHYSSLASTTATLIAVAPEWAAPAHIQSLWNKLYVYRETDCNDEQALTVCLRSVSSHDTKAEWFDQSDGVCSVYETKKTALDKLPELEDGAQAIVAGEAMPSKKAKRSSSGSSTASSAMDTFKDVMLESAQASIPIQQRNLPQNVQEFFNKCNLGDEQKKAVYEICGSDKPDVVMLVAMDDDDLTALQLSKIQKSTWKLLASKVL